MFNRFYYVLIIFFFSTYIVGQCSSFKVSDFDGVVNKGHLLRTSGDQRVDNFFEDERYRLSDFFNVNPDCFFIYENSSGNAFAQKPHPGGISYEYDRGFTGFVGFGMKLFKRKISTANKESLKYILAHEFAHIYQFYKQPHAFLSTNPYKELQADYLAGYYIGSNYNYNDQKLYTLITSIDGDYDFSSPHHHGTDSQRRNTFLEGVMNSHLDLNEAFEASSLYISLEMYNYKTTKQQFLKLSNIRETYKPPPEDLGHFYYLQTSREAALDEVRYHQKRGLPKLIIGLSALVAGGYLSLGTQEEYFENQGLAGATIAALGVGISLFSVRDFSLASLNRKRANRLEVSAYDSLK